MSSVTVAPSLTGFPVWHGSTPPLMQRGSGGVLGSISVPQQQTSFSMPPLAYDNYTMGSPQVGFFFRVEPSHHIVSYICLMSVLVSAFYFQVQSWMLYSPMGAQPLGFAPWQPFGVYPWQTYVQPGDGQWPTPGMHRVAAPSGTLGRGEPSATHSAVPQPIGGVYSLGGSIESHLIPLPSLCDGEGSSFPGLVPSDVAVNPDSILGIKPGDSSVVIGYYQVDEFTCTWSAEQFVACSHIYPGFTGKVSH